MTGKFLFELIPGTIEEGNPLDTEWTDRQYATHLRDLSAAGLVELGAAFSRCSPCITGRPTSRPLYRPGDPSVVRDFRR